MGDQGPPMSLECGHGGERRAWWCRKGRDGLGRHRRGCWPSRIVARVADRDPGRRPYRLLLRETGGRGGKTLGGAFRIDRRGRRRAGVRARVHARGAPGGPPDRGHRDRRYSLGDPRYAGLWRSGLDLLPGQPRPLRYPRGRYPDLGLICRGSLDEKGLERDSRRPRLLSFGRLRSVLPEDELFFVGACDTGTLQASVFLVLPDGGLQSSQTQGRTLGAGGDDLSSQLIDHLVVVHLQYLVHGQLAPVNVLEEHAARRHADGATFALVGSALYVLLVVGRLEVHRNDVSAARISAGHGHVGILQGAPMPRLLVVIQQYLYL